MPYPLYFNQPRPMAQKPVATARMIDYLRSNILPIEPFAIFLAHSIEKNPHWVRVEKDSSSSKRVQKSSRRRRRKGFLKRLSLPRVENLVPQLVRAAPRLMIFCGRGWKSNPEIDIIFQILIRIPCQLHQALLETL